MGGKRPVRGAISQVLLGGARFCGLCGGAMTLGTGRTGVITIPPARPRLARSQAGCAGITVPMDKLDDAVVEHLARRLLQPDRLCMLIGNVLDGRQEWVELRRSRVAELRKRSAEAANKLVRLYAAIEDGLAGQGSEGLSDRIRELEAIKKEAPADAERAEAAIDKLGR
jgi:site-specific DNA recombinase